MNGVHDMGGTEGFGPVKPEPNEPPFHSAWEGRALALNRAMSYAKVWNIDRSRAAIEEMPPHHYLTMTYYEKWALRLEKLLLEYGLVSADEIAAGRSLRPGKALPRTLAAADVAKALSRGSYSRPSNTTPQFKAGDRVRAKNIHPPTHTRLPRYARGRVGVIECVRGHHVFPDSVATGQGENPQWLYTVLFDGRELWGERADPTLKVSIEAWEPYLEPA
jgi:nitrile hydratase beta subunit